MEQGDKQSRSQMTGQFQADSDMSFKDLLGMANDPDGLLNVVLAGYIKKVLPVLGDLGVDILARPETDN